MKKFKQSNCDKTKKKSSCDKNQIVTKLKNSNGAKTQELKWRQNSKTQIVTTNCDSSKSQIVTKLNQLICDGT